LYSTENSDTGILKFVL